MRLRRLRLSSVSPNPGQAKNEQVDLSHVALRKRRPVLHPEFPMSTQARPGPSAPTTGQRNNWELQAGKSCSEIHRPPVFETTTCSTTPDFSVHSPDIFQAQEHPSFSSVQDLIRGTLMDLDKPIGQEDLIDSRRISVRPKFTGNPRNRLHSAS